MDILTDNMYIPIASYLQPRHITPPENIDKQGNYTGLDDRIDWKRTFCTKVLIRAVKISQLQ
jgi:hypothetical protein